MKKPSIISMGGYLPAKKLPAEKAKILAQFLREETLVPVEYIKEIEETFTLPGKVETNFDGWASQPWYDEWVKTLPEKKQADPFQGAVERRRVPLDPRSLRMSMYAHPMWGSDAETISAAMAIVNSGIDKDDIDLILVHSQTPDRPLPANASLVQHKLGLKNAHAIEMDSCCSTFVSMLEAAIAYVHAGIYKNVLITSSFIDSQVLDRTTHFSIDTGDGSSAAIISLADRGYISSASRSDGYFHDAIIYERRSPAMHIQTGCGPSYLGDKTTFKNMEKCKELAKGTGDFILEIIDKMLKKVNLTVADIDFLVTHQPVSWAPDTWRQALGLPPEKFHHTFQKYANIATAAAPTNLLEALEEGKIKEGDKVVITSSGAGENMIAVMFEADIRLIKSMA